MSSVLKKADKLNLKKKKKKKKTVDTDGMVLQQQSINRNIVGYIPMLHF